MPNYGSVLMTNVLMVAERDMGDTEGNSSGKSHSDGHSGKVGNFLDRMPSAVF